MEWEKRRGRGKQANKEKRPTKGEGGEKNEEQTT